MMLHYRKSSDASQRGEAETEHEPRFRTRLSEAVERVEPIEGQRIEVNAVDPNDADLHEMEMQALIRRIGRHSVLQKSVLAQLGDANLTTTTVRSLVTLLQGPFAERWRERLAAVWALGRLDLSPCHRIAVVSALQNVLLNSHTYSAVNLNDRGRSAWSRALPPAALFGGMVAVCTFKSLLPTLTGGVFSEIHALSMALLVSGLDGLIVAFCSALCLFPVILPVSYALDSDRNVRVRAEAARALGQLQLPETIGALARASLDLSHTVRAAAEAALVATLPTLTQGHYGLLDIHTVSYLCRLLNLRRHQMFADSIGTEDLVVEILKALGKIGDGSAVPLVESIAKVGWTERARCAALETLPILQNRFKKEQDHRLLLRGACAPVDPCCLLLRSAQEEVQTLPDTLLRPLGE